MTLPRPALRAAALALGLPLLLGACTTATADEGTGATQSGSSADPSFPDGPGPSDTPDPALSGQPVPTLPPGDPGTGSDADTEGGEDPHEGEHGAVTDVPVTALLDAETVGAIAGESWAADAQPGEECLVATPHGAAGRRSSVLTAGSGRLVQTVASWPGARAARKAVAAAAEGLAGCGFTATGDPRLGDASAALERPVGGAAERAVVLASEGVTVVLVARGSAATDGVWESLADIALGTSCAASAHGCH